MDRHFPPLMPPCLNFCSRHRFPPPRRAQDKKLPFLPMAARRGDPFIFFFRSADVHKNLKPRLSPSHSPAVDCFLILFEFAPKRRIKSMVEPKDSKLFPHLPWRADDERGRQDRTPRPTREFRQSWPTFRWVPHGVLWRTPAEFRLISHDGRAVVTACPTAVVGSWVEKNKHPSTRTEFPEIDSKLPKNI